MTTHVQRSLHLSPAEWAALDALAVTLNAVPSQGSQTTTPTWRTLVKWVAQGKLTVVPTALIAALASAAFQTEAWEVVDGGIVWPETVTVKTATIQALLAAVTPAEGKE